MTSDVEVELGGPEVSLVSGLEWVGGLQTQEVVGALWDGRKVVGWEQFLKKQHKAPWGITYVPGFSTTLVQHEKLCPHRAKRQLQWNIHVGMTDRWLLSTGFYLLTVKDKAFRFSFILFMAFLT